MLNNKRINYTKLYNPFDYAPPINEYLYGYYTDFEDSLLKSNFIKKIVICKYKKINENYYKKVWFECINNDLNNLIECNRPLFWKKFEVKES